MVSPGIVAFKSPQMHALEPRPGTESEEEMQSANTPNAMIFQVIRTGDVFFYDGSAVLVQSLPPSIAKMAIANLVGKVLQKPEEHQELWAILNDLKQERRYVLDNSETVRVLARFYI